MGYLFAAGAALSYAVGTVTTRMVVRELASPLVSAFFSLTFGTLFFFLVFVLPQLPREVRASSSPRGLLFFAAAGGVSSLGMIAMYTALKQAPVVVVSLATSVYPLFALLFVHLFLRRWEQVTWRILLGALLVVGGVMLITYSQV